MRNITAVVVSILVLGFVAAEPHAAAAAAPRSGAAQVRTNASGQMSRMGSQHAAITDADVIKMVQAGIPETAIIASIRSGPVNFDLSANALIALHRAGVGQNILDVMLAIGSGGKSGPSQPLSASRATHATWVKGARAPAAQLMRIKLAGAPAASLDPAIAKTLEEQSARAREERPGALSGAGAQAAISGSRSNSHSLLPAGGSIPGGSLQPRAAAGGSRPMTKMARASQPISACRFSSEPTIESISGKSRAVIFTPDPGPGPNPRNQYTIKGCNFGAAQGQGEVHLVGGFVNHSGPVRLAIDNWSDDLIVANLDPRFVDEYDLDNITLVVVAANGHSAQLPGNSFVATRASRPLRLIPRGVAVKYDIHAGSESGFSASKNYFISPVSVSNPGTKSIVWSLNTAQQEHWTAVLEHDLPITDYSAGHDAWHVDIDFNRLRRGFALDGDMQTVMVGYPDLDTSSGIFLSSGSCNSEQLTVGGALQGKVLHLDVQPMECDANGKFAWAHYALILSVTGPKGEKLNPWIDGL
jgi:hypothetical protein